MIHELKTYPEHFEKVISGEKTFEYRFNDRNFRVGDYVALNEYKEGSGYTGRSALFRITHIAGKEQMPVPLPKGYVILSIYPCFFEGMYNRHHRDSFVTVTDPFKKEDTI